MGRIRINYDNVFRHSARLRSIAGERREAANGLESVRDQLSASWQDQAGAAYQAAAAELAAEIRRTADELEQVGALIKNAATEFRETEEANAKAAKRLAT